MKFVILMPIVVFFYLREPFIAHNINGIGITNSKKKNIYIYIYINYAVNKEGTNY